MTDTDDPAGATPADRMRDGRGHGRNDGRNDGLGNGSGAGGRVVVVMGVSGCGKSTIAEHLAAHLSADFLDGDTLHPKANIDKMSRGEPLDDDDRTPWLQAVRDTAAERAARYGVHVVACSSLKRDYREILRGAGAVSFVFLDGSRELIASRMHERRGHFMPETLLDSQFEALQRPDGEPGVVVVSIDADPDTIAADAAAALAELHRESPA